MHAEISCDKVGEWLNVSDIHSAGGTRLNQFYTVPLCLHVCRDLLDNCVAVDIDSRLHDEIRCWVHTNASDLDETYRAVGLTQYRLVKPCAQPGNIVLSPIHTADETKLSSFVASASAVCT